MYGTIVNVSLYNGILISLIFFEISIYCYFFIHIKNYQYIVAANNEKWIKNYNILLEFVNTHDRIPKRIEYPRNNNEKLENKLSEWCNTRRLEYNGKRGIELKSEYKEMLEKIQLWYWSEKNNN